MAPGEDLSIDLNADAGESFGHWKLGQDEALLAQLTSVNLACGFHAGDPLVMFDSIERAARLDVAVGAHPGYPDLAGFGRRYLAMNTEELYSAVIYQVGALKSMLEAKGMCLHHVKAHGALYLKMTQDAGTAESVARAVSFVAPGTPLVVLGGPGGAKMRTAAIRNGLAFVNEAFPDRSYDANGFLLPRSHPEALILDPVVAAARAVDMVRRGRVTSADGGSAELEADTLCIHGDNPESVQIASAVREALVTSGVHLRAF